MPESIKVKPLEWWQSQHKNKPDAGGGPPTGCEIINIWYRVKPVNRRSRVNNNYLAWFRSGGDDYDEAVSGGVYPDLESAKAACEEHWREMVLSCLELEESTP